MITPDFCFWCPPDLSHYSVEVGEHFTKELPLRFMVPSDYQGHMVEFAFSAYGGADSERGDRYMRRTDNRATPPTIAYYRHR